MTRVFRRSNGTVNVTATFIPAPPISLAQSIQLNDVFVDEHKIDYTLDRFAGGLYIPEMDFERIHFVLVSPVADSLKRPAVLRGDPNSKPSV
jgi:hypothetical protein